MRKFGVLFLLIATGALCACLKPVKTGDEADSIVVWEQEDASVAPYIDSVFDAFKHLPGNEKVNITRVHYNNEDLRQQYQTASIAGTGPDLIMCPSDFGGVFSVAGYIKSVDGLVDLSIYNKAATDAVYLDGKHWGVPISNGNHLMLMYNKKLVAQPPQSTDELFAYCDKTVARLGLKTCLAFDGGEPFWFVPWLGGFGGWPLDNRTPTIDTPQMHDAVNFYLDLKFGRKIIPQECDYNCMDSLFKEGQAPFIINGDWSISGYADKLGKDYGVARIPKVSSTGLWPTPMVSGKYFMLNARLSGAKLDLIKKLITFYTNRDNQIKQVKMLKRLPALTSATDAPEVQNDPLLKASMDQVLVGRPMPMATELRPVWDSMRSYMGKIMTKQMGPEEGIKKMQSDVDSKVREMDR
jgi:arabinogalactan oligomer/maltooligosaccharide transport system substrate-binding protein